MDDTDWTATGLFSPSKARLAQAQAKDWVVVDAWLSKKYATSRLPTFERNEDTLQALLALVSMNEASDERRAVVERVEKAALQHFEKQQKDADQGLLGDISNSLDPLGHEAVETLTQASLTSNAPSGSGIAGIVLAATSMQLQSFEAQQAAAIALERLEALKLEHEELKRHLPSLQDASLSVPMTLVDDTTQRQRGVKHLRAKIGEYDDRLVTVRPNQSLLTLLDETKRLMCAVEDQNVQMEIVKDEITAMRSFRNAQRPAAQAMLEGAKDKAQSLRLDRDRLLRKQAQS